MNNINQEGRSEESFAKKILEKNPLAQRYGNIIERDKPDLWALEMNIGIEVTQATDQLTCEIHGLWAKGMNSNCSKTIAKCEEKIKIYNELHKVPERGPC